VDEIVKTIVTEHRANDVVVLMSNGGFGGIHEKLLRALDGVDSGATPPEAARSVPSDRRPSTGSGRPRAQSREQQTGAGSHGD
jgi:hypothetical protein